MKYFNIPIPVSCYFVIFCISFISFGCPSKSSSITQSPTVAGNSTPKSTDLKLENDTAQVTPIATKPKPKINPALEANIFLENSGSMFGYVAKGGNFVEVVSQLAGDCDLEFGKVNYTLVNGSQTNLGNDLSNFISTLSLAGMNKGDVSTSNLNEIFELGLENAGGESISIIISDGIYSVKCDDGLSSNCMIAKLKGQSIETRNAYIKRLQTEKISTYLVKFESFFDGYYYPADGGKQIISQNRPFFMWLFGNEEIISRFFNEDYFKNLPGFQDIAKFVHVQDNLISAQISIHDVIGQFKVKDPKSLVIEDAKFNSRLKELRFSIALDFSKTPYSSSYFFNKNIYENNLGYEVAEIVDPEKLNPQAKAHLMGYYSHILTLKKSGNPFGELNLVIKNEVPDWIDESSIDNDTNIKGNTKQTFGFKYLTDGISNAYKKVNDKENIVEFKIKIK
jgi:hypothetical protein